ncbi:MAG: peptide chain release factor 1 [Flavobacteriales bacterium]|nr:peptide chain release factor 1 [Flavobacteriales bacterium]|tara:strand:+ start:11559 stop:12623 length:1065 start_codon:yes stop_codon:yes gene_type:complete
MLDKLKAIKERFNEVSNLIVQPDIISNMQKYIKLNKEFKDLSPIVKTIDKYISVLKNIDEAKEILNVEIDEELRQLAKLDLDESEELKSNLEAEVKILLIPKDPDDSRNAVVEIRAGSGGDEASIFAGDLFRMYTKFIDSKKWNQEIMDVNEGISGGFKEIIFSVSGADVYGLLKYESGVHRVQRVPQTETQGRVHTSAASVVVLPEVEDFDIELKESDIKKETYCSSGPGGQSVNTTYSAVRLTHIPTGVVAQCQDQKSQIKNYAKALKVLRSRIYDIELKKRNEEIAGQRKTMVKTGDRSDKIRTYNYPQGRVTEHRIGLTLYSLNEIINGDLDKIVEELKIAENAEKLKTG